MSYLDQFLDEEVTITYLDNKSKENLIVKGKVIEIENGKNIILLNNKSFKRIFLPFVKEITTGEKEF